MAAQQFEFELVTEPDLAKMIAAEFGESIRIPDRGWFCVVFWVRLVRLGIKPWLRASASAKR